MTTDEAHTVTPKASAEVGDSESANSGGAPKKSRRWMLFVGGGALIYGTNYTDKVVFGAVGPKLIDVFHYSPFEFGLLGTLFGLSYTFLQVPITYWTDRNGRRIGISVITAFYALWTFITGFVATSFVWLAIARVMTGAGESGSMPSTTGAVTPWTGIEHRATAQGTMHSTTRIASAITVGVAASTYLALGIKGPFIVFGGVTLLAAVFWAITYRDHHSVIGTKKHWKDDFGVIAKQALHSKGLWALCIADFCYFYVLTVYAVWLPTYLSKVHHFSLAKIGTLGGIPWIGGAIGGIAFGFFADRMCKRTGNVRFWRRAVASGCLVLTVPLLMAAVYAQGSITIVLLFACSFFFMDGTIAVFWAIAMDMGGRYSGAVAAWMNTWANVGGLLSPLVFGWIVEYAHSYTIPFIVSGILLLIGAGLVWFVDPMERFDRGMEGSPDMPILGETANVGSI